MSFKHITPEQEKEIREKWIKHISRFKRGVHSRLEDHVYYISREDMEDDEYWYTEKEIVEHFWLTLLDEEIGKREAKILEELEGGKEKKTLIKSSGLSTEAIQYHAYTDGFNAGLDRAKEIITKSKQQ